MHRNIASIDRTEARKHLTADDFIVFADERLNDHIVFVIFYTTVNVVFDHLHFTDVRLHIMTAEVEFRVRFKGIFCRAPRVINSFFKGNLGANLPVNADVDIQKRSIPLGISAGGDRLERHEPFAEVLNARIIPADEQNIILAVQRGGGFKITAGHRVFYILFHKLLYGKHL